MLSLSHKLKLIRYEKSSTLYFSIDNWPCRLFAEEAGIQGGHEIPGRGRHRDQVRC